jgi:sugar-specific transcriptional regulator TrmB
MLPDILAQLGLNKNEVELFLQLARMESAPASLVAQKVRIRRTTCYQVLENLVKQGLIKRSIRFGIRYYSALSPSEIEARINDTINPLINAKESLQKDSKEIRRFYGQKSPEAKISFYEGFDEIKLVYEKLLAEEDKNIYSILRKQDTTNHPLQPFWKKYLKKRLALGKTTYALVPNDKSSKAYISENKKEKRETLCVSQKKLHIFGDLKVSGDLFAYVSQHEGRIFGITMESPHIAAMFRDIIKILWKDLSKQK